MTRKGFTLVEMLIALSMISILLAIAIPFMRVSPMRQVRLAATQLSRDLEMTRTRALSARLATRVTFDVGSPAAYIGYADADGDGTIAENSAEMSALRGFNRRELDPRLSYGRGNAGAVPGDTAGSGAITFPVDHVEFSPRGVTFPFGTRGAVYFVHNDDPDAVAAVSVTGSGSVKLWVYMGGTWQ
jgi:prepilin-type N-terminal cleavage/methylation domain-containing protein